MNMCGSEQSEQISKQLRNESAVGDCAQLHFEF